MYNQTNEFGYLEGNVYHNADLSIEVNRRIRNVWCSFRKYTLELYDRPSAPLELKIRMLRVEVLETMLYGRVKPAHVPLRHAAPSPSQLPDLLDRLGKEQSHRPPDFISGHAYEDEKLEHLGDYTQEADSVRGICGAHGGHETAEVRDVRSTSGGHRLRWGSGKRVDGVLSTYRIRLDH